MAHQSSVERRVCSALCLVIAAAISAVFVGMALAATGAGLGCLLGVLGGR